MSTFQKSRIFKISFFTKVTLFQISNSSEFMDKKHKKCDFAPVWNSAIILESKQSICNGRKCCIIYILQVFLEAIPYITIIVLNALIVRQIVTSGKFRRKFVRRTMSSNGGITTKVEHIERSGNVESIERKNVPNVKSSSLVNLTGVRKPKSPRFITTAKKNGRKRHFGQVHVQ